MPSIDKFFWMNLPCSLFFFNLTQLWATEKVAKRTDHAQAVGAIIVNCGKKQCLQHSRSSHLRCCVDKAVAKANFLRRNRDDLIEKMMTSQISFKSYRIERFVNPQYTQSICSAR
jgi:hypothetical protein